MDNNLKEKCNVIGELIPKLAKIYDGLEELECVDKVDEIKSDYDNILNGSSTHIIQVRFNVVPFHEQIEAVTKKLNDLVESKDATLENMFVRGPGLDDYNRDLNFSMFEIEINWRYK